MAIQPSDPPSRDDTNEQTPLLAHTAHAAPPNPKTAATLHRKVIFLMCLMLVTININSYLQMIPRVRLYEIVYCRQYYEEVNPGLIGPGGVVDEELCKVNIVQSQVALLSGWGKAFDYAPGIFLAVPFGILADRYGRRRLLALNVLVITLRQAWIYFILSFPTIFNIKLIWLQTVFQLLGGGDMVAVSLIFTICNDVTAQTKLSTVFNRIGGMSQIALVIAPLLTATLMKLDPWIPVTLGLGLQFLCLPIVLLVPETLNLPKEGPSSDSSQTSNALSSTSSDSLAPSPSNSLYCSKPHRPLSLPWIKAHLAPFLPTIAFLFQSWRIPFLTATYPPRMLQNDLDNLLVQYIPKRFHWPLSDTNFVWSLEAAFNSGVMFFFMPFLSTLLLTRFRYSATGKDVWVARVGNTLNAIFALAQGFAPTAGFFVVAMVGSTLGSGVGASIRALLTSYVRANEVARLYTMMAIVETASMTVSGPAMAGIFTAGLNRGGIWEGLPWIVAGALFAVVAGALWVARLNDKGEEKVAGEGNGGMEEGLERGSEGFDGLAA